jgi:alpha-ketoglutarate-dependent taurine dioxygenase
MDLAKGKLPLIVEPTSKRNSKTHLIEWIQSDAKKFSKSFLEAGAVLFRGFQIKTPKDFQDIALQIDPRLEKEYYGTSPRNSVTGTDYVYTASELPAYYPIMQHCEMSYVQNPPVTLFFYCHIEPKYGGETPLCDFRKVYAQLDTSIRQEFDKKGVISVRNYSGLKSNTKWNLFELKRWDQVFRTTDKSEVERQCKEQDIEFEWCKNDRLRLIHRTAASIQHPVSGDRTWFNHSQVFHVSASQYEYESIHDRQNRFNSLLWKQLTKLMVQVKKRNAKPMDQSLNVLFGDGTSIPDSYIAHIEEVIWNNLVIIPWKKNDVIAIDNFSTSHGRLPYKGAREILACWSVDPSLQIRKIQEPRFEFTSKKAV